MADTKVLEARIWLGQWAGGGESLSLTALNQRKRGMGLISGLGVQGDDSELSDLSVQAPLA